MSRIAFVNVVLPDPLSPATPMVKMYGEAAMVSLKLGRDMVVLLPVSR
jgi:hypothetical protein